MMLKQHIKFTIVGKWQFRIQGMSKRQQQRKFDVEIKSHVSWTLKLNELYGKGIYLFGCKI